MQRTIPTIERSDFKRLIQLNNKKDKKYAKYGVLFAAAEQPCTNQAIDFYNQGCPTESWQIAPAIIKHNNFRVFATGDAFSVMAPDVNVSHQDVNIHVGLTHKSYSPLVLLHEALQLCRNAQEHGAKSITVALPEQFHPVTYCSDFNNLLLSLFKASGATNIYFYDTNYNGKLDKKNMTSTITLVDKEKIHQYLDTEQDGIDSQVMHLIRNKKFTSIWAKFNANNTDNLGSLIGDQQNASLNISNSENKPHVILCCSANKPLADKIAESLRSRGEDVKLYSVDGEGDLASIPKDATICNAVVTIVQSTRPSTNFCSAAKNYQINGASAYLFEAATIARQAKLRGAKSINLINPYQFGARSDKAEDNSKGKAGAYVQLNGLLLEAAGVNQVITAECHDAHTITGTYTGKNMRGTAIPALSIMTKQLAIDWATNASSLQGQLRLVTPDAGATKRTKELAESLQAIMGNKLCKTGINGEKQRDSHADTNALITSLNAGDISINPHDRYLITDDETATGSTLAQAISNIKKAGAKLISVAVVHNNMPLDWLTRQLCLARFFYLGADEVHFSDTQEMGTLASSYDDLIAMEPQIFAWFKDNIGANFADKSDANLAREFNQFKTMFNQFDHIKIHSLADEFAEKLHSDLPLDMRVRFVV